jgi:hypothetical protein
MNVPSIAQVQVLSNLLQSSNLLHINKCLKAGPPMNAIKLLFNMGMNAMSTDYPVTPQSLLAVI